jgi:CubicO group peptidase (beta-lactamase class C family)
MADLEETLRPYVDSGDVPGLVALVAQGDDVEVVTLGTQGSSGAPMARDSIFRAASITKPVMAALTMTLVDDGLIDLDVPVADLLPELAEPRVLRTLGSPLDDTVACERPITARHLLTGTSGHGFCTWESAVAPLLMEQLHQAADDIHAVPAPDEWMSRLSQIPLMHQPGEGWTYNASYDVLGVLVARAAGQDLAGVMAERLLEPLGMTDTGFHAPADGVGRFTTMYGAEDGELVVRDEPDGVFDHPPAFASGSGGLVTTADDWLAFGRMLLADGGGLLRPESVRLMTTDHTTPRHREMGGFFLDGQGWGFGGGVDTELIDPWNVIGRYGWVGGTGTSAYVHPDGTVAILLTQVVLGSPGIEDLLKAFWTYTRTAGDKPPARP